MKAKMKIIFSSVLLFSLTLSSCSNVNKFLRRPANSNLTFWITEKVDDEQLETSTLIPEFYSENFKAEQYLDAKYQPVEGETKYNMIPEIHVTYRVSPYPNYNDEGKYITGISITDPTILVYGLNIFSTKDEISRTMKIKGFKLNCAECSGVAEYWHKNNCSFTFYPDSSIEIVALVSNTETFMY